MKKQNIKSYATNLLLSYGVRPKLAGFHYLVAAVELAYEAPEHLNSVTKTLYPAIGRKYNHSPVAIERAIRGAIRSLDMTNKEFITLVLTMYDQCC